MHHKNSYLSELYLSLGNKKKSATYKRIATQIKQIHSKTFMNDAGMLCASTGKSNQADVWSTSLAIYWNMMEESNMKKACNHLIKAYKEGALSCKGNVRHVIRGEDYSSSTAWQISKAPLNTYQNGAYWGTPVGWVAYAISKVNPIEAQKLVKEYINDLRENDYRKRENYHAPYECFFPPDYFRGPVYLTSVSCPYIVFKSLK